MYGVIKTNGRRISTFEEWPKPKRRDQWKDERSAKESAQAWLASVPSIPSEIIETLSSHHDFGPLSDWCAEPEARVPFDRFRGEPANLDVLLVGQDQNGHIVVAVEAKADEPFSQTVRETLSSARSRLKNNPASKGVARIEQLLNALFGATTTQTDILDLRYQLMTATAAVMAEAQRLSIQRAVVMIHEFITSATSDTKRASNARDLNQFVARVSGRHDPLTSGMLQGPFNVPGAPIVEAEISLYFGKAVIDKRGIEQ